MKEQLITLDTAKLAKEKGFDANCENYWVETLEHTLHIPRSGEEVFPAHAPRVLSFTPTEKFHITHGLAPTQSLLQKWLREIHNIDVSAHIIRLDDRLNAFIYYPTILTPKKGTSWENIWESNYEEALEKGLQEALKLIKTK
jgi:hypothetical protein